MTNKDFIKQYGKYEFKFLKDDVYIILFNYKNNKIIKGFRLYNKKNIAYIYFDYNGKSADVRLEYAMIYSVKEKGLLETCKRKYDEQKKKNYCK